jgi:class 3 adenylate cyclase/predicted ATPase
MRCRACGSENPDTARFCGSCGVRQTVSCPHCLADVAPSLRFCTTCGGALPEPRAEPDAVAEGETASAAERRIISVLFADLENFTPLAESLDPEEVRNVLSAYFEVARAVVARYDGTLEKFIGDAVMAVWGAPSAHEDDPERAVRAGLELLAAVGRLGGAVADKGLRARAAVATGEAAVTLGAEGQGMVAGDLVNTAARLQASAPSGGLLVAEATRHAAEGAIVFEPAGPRNLRGKAAAVETWRAIGPVSQPARGRGAGHAGLFVGRKHELEELIGLFEQTVRDGRSRLVSVIGIAGIGKSRLAWELERHVDALAYDVAWHTGRAPAYGDGIAFAALAEMVRRRAAIAEGDTAAVARRQLSTVLAQLVPNDGEREWIEPRLAVLLDPTGQVAHEREELFAAWRHFFEAVADLTPAVLVFEDLQWADAGLLDFIDHLAAWARRPMLIVTLARPELLDRRPTWGAEQHRFTVIHLDRLGDEVMDQLVDALTPGLPEDGVRRVLDRADGVPLYAVEMARMLLERGDVGSPGRSGEQASVHVEIPDSLHALIAARIDAQPPGDRTLLLSGSVLGRRFHPDALAVVTGGEPGAVREAIPRLVRRELLAVDDELRSPGRGQVSFVQDLVREVAYRTLSRRERRELHLAAAAFLEAHEEEEHVEALASHLVEAHAAAPGHADAPATARRAVSALRLAAGRATALHTPALALGHLERAIDLTGDSDVLAELWDEAAVAARAAARLDEAERYLRQLVAWATAAGRADAAAKATAQLASLLLMAQRNEAALRELEVALERVVDLESEPASLELAGQLARGRVLNGEDQAGAEWAERTYAAADRLGLAVVATDALVTLGTARVRLGDPKAGLADLRRAIEQASEHGLLSVELRARNNLAWLIVTDDPRATLETARDGMELATRMGFGDMALQLAAVACAAAIDTGDWEWSLTTLADVDRPALADSYRIDFGTTAATLRALLGDEDPERELRGLEPIDPATDRQLVAAIDYARAWIAFAAGRFDEARSLARAAAGRALATERFHARAIAARASLWLGDGKALGAELAQLNDVAISGRAGDAVRLTLEAGHAALAGKPSTEPYERAIALWRELRLDPHLAMCLIERHRFAGASGSEDGLAEARDILQRLGGDGLLALIDASVRPG